MLDALSVASRERFDGFWPRHVIDGAFKIWDLSTPVIAEVHGYCLAGGTELAASCDLVYVAHDAEIGYPVVRSMSPPDNQFFPWLMGMRNAMEMMLTGESISGEEAASQGIGQGYIQTTPLQLCLMTAQLANGGFKIYPKIIVNEQQDSLETIKNKISKEIIKKKQGQFGIIEKGEKFFKSFSDEYEPLFRNQENIKFILEAMYGATNEIMGTSYASRFEDKKYQFAGKTGTAQVKRITEEERELDLHIDLN